MSEFENIQIIYLVGWLVLAGGALAAYRLSWKKGLVLALIWGSIFALVFLIFSAVRSG